MPKWKQGQAKSGLSETGAASQQGHLCHGVTEQPSHPSHPATGLTMLGTTGSLQGEGKISLGFIFFF